MYFQMINFRKGQNFLFLPSLIYFFSHKSKDEMTLEISAKDSSGYEAVKSTTFVFHVYPESYWEPLAIASNNSILVEESTSIAITRYDLQVESRTEMSPTDIIYMVRKSVLSTFAFFISVYCRNSKENSAIQIWREIKFGKFSMSKMPIWSL